MGAVVLGHVVYNNNVSSMDGFCWHIPGFLLISGYFGIRFSWRKILVLVGIVYGSYWLTIPFRWGADSLLSLILPHGGWFFPFYCVLMLLSPVLNAAMKERESFKPILTSVVLLLLIGWIPTLTSNLHARMMYVAGLQGKGLLLMFATYFIGASLNRFKAESLLPPFAWAIGFLAGTAALAFLGKLLLTNSFASPAAILTAVFGFLFFASMPKISGWPAKIIHFISPSMFGVYILHETCIRNMQIITSGVGWSHAVSHALWLFSLCLLIDCCRRFIVWGIKRFLLMIPHFRDRQG